MNGQLMAPDKSPATPNTPDTSRTPSRTRQPSPKTTADPASPRSVLMIGSEALPFSKTGGLADVLGALPQALARLGWDITLVIPRYRGSGDGELGDHFDLRIGGVAAGISMFEAPLGSARAFLVDEPTLYDRDHLYATDI